MPNSKKKITSFTELVRLARQRKLIDSKDIDLDWWGWTLYSKLSVPYEQALALEKQRIRMMEGMHGEHGEQTNHYLKTKAEQNLHRFGIFPNGIKTKKGRVVLAAVRRIKKGVVQLHSSRHVPAWLTISGNRDSALNKLTRRRMKRRPN